MDLEKEAAEEFDKVPHTIKRPDQYLICKIGFIEGYKIAKEKLKAEKIKAQIEAVRAVDTYGLSHMLNHYEQQLKELEHGKDGHADVD